MVSVAEWLFRTCKGKQVVDWIVFPFWLAILLLFLFVLWVRKTAEEYKYRRYRRGVKTVPHLPELR